MHKVLHGDRATARRAGIDRRGRPEGEIVEVLERANRDVVGRLHEERGITFVVAENRRINQDLLVPPGRARQREARRRRRRRDRRAAVAAARGDRPRRRGARRLHRPRHGDRDRAAQARSAARILGCGGAQAGRQAADGSHATADRKGRTDLTALPLVTIDGETAKDFDDAVYCERERQGLPPHRRDRRRLALRARRRCARPRRARARHVGLLPAPRDPDAAGGAVERALLAQAGRRPAVHGLRHGDRPPRARSRKYEFYPAVMHSRARLTYTQVWSWLSNADERAARSEAAAAAAARPLRAVPRAQGARAKPAARSTSTRVEMQLEFDVQRQDRPRSCRSCATTRTS